MLNVKHSVDYLKKKKANSETLEGVQHVEQIALLRNALRFKRSDDNPELSNDKDKLNKFAKAVAGKIKKSLKKVFRNRRRERYV